MHTILPTYYATILAGGKLEFPQVLYYDDNDNRMVWRRR